MTKRCISAIVVAGGLGVDRARRNVAYAPALNTIVAAAITLSRNLPFNENPAGQQYFTSRFPHFSIMRRRGNKSSKVCATYHADRVGAKYTPRFPMLSFGRRTRVPTRDRLWRAAGLKTHRSTATILPYVIYARGQ